MITEEDTAFMQEALKIASKARMIAPPNPWVGCILVKNGVIIGEGCTQKIGEAHAEVAALHSANGQAEGATAYITLEPCIHFGRTPPCAKALASARIKRAVIAIEDPDSRVAGKGIAFLREAGIEVAVGACQQQATHLLTPYLYHRRTGLPYCILKAGISLDGRLAASDKTSQWITCRTARADAHRLRAESQAIMVGAGTVQLDNPSLTVRDVTPLPPLPPLRIAVDAKGCLDPIGPLFDLSLGSTLIITSDKCPLTKRSGWEKAGIEVAVVPSLQEGRLDIFSLLKLLGERGIIQLLVEGGSTLLGQFIQTPYPNELILYYGSQILGDSGLPLFKNYFVDTMRHAKQCTLKGVEKVGDCVRLNYTIGNT